jgi:hypothetical protein
VLPENISECFVGEFLDGRHPVAPQLLQLIEGIVVEGDQLAHQRPVFLRRKMDADSITVGGNRSGAEPVTHAVVEIRSGDFLMTKISVAASIIAIAILVGPAGSFAQSGGGSGGGGGSASGPASDPSAGIGSAVGSPSAGSAAAGTAGVSGVPSGPANVGGLNNSGNDPSGAGNSSKLASPPSGTNSAGTANSSGSPATTGSSTTTGSARSAPGGTAATGPQDKGDVAIDKEDQAINRKLKTICRGC